MRQGFIWSPVLGAVLVAVCATARADRGSYDARYGLINMGGFVVFFNSQGPLSYAAPVRSELPPDAVPAGPVFCRSCQHGLSLPTSFNSGNRSMNVSGAQGDGSFRKALGNLLKKRPDLKGVYDVKVDLRRTSVLGFYRRVCTEVTAQGFR